MKSFANTHLSGKKKEKKYGIRDRVVIDRSRFIHGRICGSRL